LFKAEGAPRKRHGNFVAPHLAQSDINDLRERIAIEDAGNGIANVEHEHAQAAMRLIGTRATAVRCLAYTSDRCERTIKEPNDRAKFYAMRGSGQQVAAKLAPFSLDVSRCPHLGENLLKELNRELFLRSQFAHLKDGSTKLSGDSEIDQGPQGVFASFGKVHPLVI